jgi:hypothetical protein
MKLVIVSSSSGDWEGLYKDGIRLAEDHSLRTEDVLKLAGIEIEHKEAAEGWVEDRGDLPVLLKEVKF